MQLSELLLSKEQKTSIGKDVEKVEPYTLLVETQIGAETLLLGIYPKKLKSRSQSNISTPVFITVLFTVEDVETS